MKDFVTRTIECPHCGQHTSIDIDASNGDQDYYDDCHVCCESIHCRVVRDESRDKLVVFVDADDEQMF